MTGITSPGASATPIPGNATAASARLILIGLSSWLVYAVVVRLSSRFAFSTAQADRPIPLMLGLFAALFALYVLGLRFALRVNNPWPTVLVFSAAFRLLVLFSEPIQEVDIYRYVWDGEVLAAGVSPYRYSPAQVQAAAAADEGLPRDLRRLAELRDSDPPLAVFLSRIHFADLTTIYPPVSQAVFAAATSVTPRGADVTTRLLVMKAWLVGFDLLTLVILWRLLRFMGRPVGWALAYGWCPLVVKEFANSGHLDSIAVCFTLLALWLAVRGLSQMTGRAGWQTLLSSLALALATGAKLYPVVLFPLLFLSMLRRLGWRSAVTSAAVYGALCGALLSPMLLMKTAETGQPRGTRHEPGQVAEIAAPAPYVERPVPRLNPEAPIDVEPQATPPGSQGTLSPATSAPGSGLHAFLSHWKMNDFLFLILEANLRPDDPEHAAAIRPWFVVTPPAWRRAAIAPVVAIADGDDATAAFLVARATTVAVFLLLSGSWAFGAARNADNEHVLRAAFLTLAWFWLLSPTLNPWYWIWALPLVPFARGRSWLVMSGLVMLYYLRFWFAAQWPNGTMAGTPYSGAAFFDFVVTWLEFGPWFGVLFSEVLWRRSNQ